MYPLSMRFDLIVLCFSMFFSTSALLWGSALVIIFKIMTANFLAAAITAANLPFLKAIRLKKALIHDSFLYRLNTSVTAGGGHRDGFKITGTT